VDTGKAVVVVVDAGEVTTLVKTSNSAEVIHLETCSRPRLKWSI